MNRYRIRVKKHRDDSTRDIKEDLTAPIWPTVATFQTYADLHLETDSVIKNIVENHVQQSEEMHATHFEYNHRETVDLVRNEKGGGKLWEGTVEFPDKIVDKYPLEDR